MGIGWGSDLEAALIILALVIGILLPTGSVLGFLAFVARNQYQSRIEKLEGEVAALRQTLSDTQGPSSASDEKPSPTETDQHSQQPSTTQILAAAREKYRTRPDTNGSELWRRARENWMVWLGGISVGLAGIFMVSHSIAIGLIGPTQQFFLALLTGVALHLGAEYLRRRHQRSDPIFAALAGGGSITLYAALLAGVHHFQLIGPTTALAGLTLVSLSTIWLALLHGPLLAAMGITGAYLIPVLVGGDKGSTPFLLGYSFLITLSSMLLMRQVFRHWLWHGTLAGALLWWLITIHSGPPEAATAWYLAALLLIFGIMSDNERLADAKLRNVLLPLLLLWSLSIAAQPSDSPFFWSWLLILPAAVLVSRSHDRLWYLPWGAVLLSAIGWLGYRVGIRTHSLHLLSFPSGYEAGLTGYLILATLLTTGLALWQWRRNGDLRRWVSLCLLAPLVWLTLAWLLLHGQQISGEWAVWTFLLGGLYGFMAWHIERRRLGQTAVAFAIMAAHISYSLAMAMWFREASLTLALAVQLISLTWLTRRYDMPELGWLIKIALALIVARLTFNPWIADYEIGDHWTLWTYGGATLCALIASRLTLDQAMRPWLEAASLHLLVLFLGTELRYWLYDGDVFARRFNMTEATLNTLLWGALSITYMVRARTSESLAWLYRWFARILLVLAGLGYLSLVTLHNPWWSQHTVGNTPVFNLLLLSYGAPVLLCAWISRFPQLAPPKALLAIAASGFMLFTGLEIRHLWQGTDLALSYGVSEGELYSYSVIGLLYAIIAIIVATRAGNLVVYKVGMTLLGLVIAKIFLVDMAGLQGLWRVAAFMGLGLALLGLAWMYRTIGRPGTGS